MYARSRNAGFSLLELMIVVAVIGILASVALPSYRESVARSDRAQARAEVLRAEGWMERYYTENNRYSNTAAATTTNPAGFASNFGNVPSTGTAKYTISLTVAAATTTAPPTYTITATPTGPMASDVCGTYTKVSNGALTASGSASSGNCFK
jgi:type IV pilus assembly protein PilE